ncbi:hypothetical protein OROHE_009022 [Orobanche hederae]
MQRQLDTGKNKARIPCPCRDNWTQEKIKLALKKNLKKKARCAGPHDRLVDLEEVVLHVNPFTSQLNSTVHETKEESFEDSLLKLEDVIFGPRWNTNDDEMATHVEDSFGTESFIHADVILLYLRKEPGASLAKDLKYNEYSYILFVVHNDIIAWLFFGYRMRKKAQVPSCASYGIMQVSNICRLFKQLWTNLKGENSNIPHVIKRTVKGTWCRTNYSNSKSFYLNMIVCTPPNDGKTRSSKWLTRSYAKGIWWVELNTTRPLLSDLLLSNYSIRDREDVVDENLSPVLVESESGKVMEVMSSDDAPVDTVVSGSG